jgi:hypothetical protein
MAFTFPVSWINIDVLGMEALGTMIRETVALYPKSTIFTGKILHIL